MIKAIVFDLDGVIVDSEPLHFRAFLAVAREHGVEFSYAQYLEHYVGYDDRDGFRAMLADRPVQGSQAGPDDVTLRDLCRRKADVFESAVAESIKPLPGAEPLVQAFASRQFPLAIATGASRQDAHLILEATRLLDRFDAVVTADDVPQSKPDPATYRLAFDRLTEKYPDLGIGPRHCLAIEDTPAGIRSAKAAGLMALGVGTTHPVDRLTEADHVVKSLDRLDVQQLLDWFSGKT